MPPSRLLQLHGVIVDLIYHVQEVPKSGGEAIVGKFDVTSGGGFNAMVAAKRSGMSVAYAGAVGTGPFGDLVAAALSDEGIERLRPRSQDRDQGCCTVMLEPSGERTFVASEGAEGFISLRELERIYLPEFQWCLLSGYALAYAGSRDAFFKWLSAASDIPKMIFDPSPLVGMIDSAVIDAAIGTSTWVSANRAEAEVLTGHKDPEVSAVELARDRPGHGGAIVRCGADGCIVATGDVAQAVRGHEVNAIDTNGAGDAHLGAFVAALSRGEPPIEAASTANIAAALSTTLHGPATAPDLETIKKTQRFKRVS